MHRWLRPLRRLAPAVAALLLLAPPAAAEAAVPEEAPRVEIRPPLLVAGLALGPEEVVFGWAGDLWAVARSGGTARRLTGGPAEDAFPAVSPDGRRLALSRRTAAGWDVHVLDLAAGGEPRRLTWHPATDWVRGWTPDGERVLFASDRGPAFTDRLYTIAADGPWPEPLPVPLGYDGALAPDGRRLAYLPHSLPYEVIEWRHYRGGLTSPLWMAELPAPAGEASGSGTPRFEELADARSNHRFPMWVDGRLHYLSDATGAFELYAHDRPAPRRLTDSAVPGLAAAATDGRSVAFVRDGRLHLLDPATGGEREVPVVLHAPAPELAPRTAPVGPFVESAVLGPDGRIVLGARGEAVRLGADGRAENLTATPWVAERYPVVSPDGRLLALFSDAGGEYGLELLDAASGTLRERIEIEPEPSFYRELAWSPDGRRLVFSDVRLALWLLDLDRPPAERLRRIAVSDYVAQGEYRPSFSPDGRWLAYSMALPSRLRAVFVHEPESGRTVRVSDGTTHATHPVFDRGGRWLAFVSSGDARLAAASDIGWGLLSTERAEPLITRDLYAVSLVAGDRPPWAPGASADGADGADGGDGSAGDPPRRVALDDLPGRIVPLPAPTRDYVDLAAGPPGVLLARAIDWPTTPGAARRLPTPVLRVDLARPDEPVELAADADEVVVAGDGGRLLLRRGNDWSLRALAAAPAAGESEPPEETAIDLSGATIEVDPRREWPQMLAEAARLLRDFFYDPGFHGQDPAALHARAAAYLPSVTRRTDLNTLLERMLGAVSVSHLGVGGGDRPDPPASGPRVALVGADFRPDGDRYRIERVLRTPHFGATDPGLRAPLDLPWIDVRDGDVLLAVDGEEVTTGRNLYSFFQLERRGPVEMTVAATPDGADRRTVVVEPLSSTRTLRTLAWAAENARRVEELSDGRLGYVHVRSYGGGIADFYRAILAGADVEGLVIDQRYNGGGTTADSLIEAVTRAPLYRYAYRHGASFPVSPVALPQPKVLLVNGWNFSAAETFALMFDLADAGPIVGTRTAGGGIGAALFQPRLVDGGRIRIPNRAAYDPAGSWRIENRGIEPHVEVPIPPADALAGRDPQLEAAVRLALEAIEAYRPSGDRRPPYPVYPRR